MKGLIIKVIRYMNIESEIEDFHRIHRTIEEGIIFKGTNLWILVFAIVVASVGLNMNSTAVIIGAMLISPLMGPINGMGYSLATYNFPLFRKALKNFVFAVIASIIASTAYFAISPVSTAHSELLARTSPTIYDVLIAFFGGLAGILAISSRLKGNVIPGVAIATALMPPLCTAGYGLATAQFAYFFGAFYLFTINTVFIAIASVLVSQVLKLPIITLVDSAQKRRVNQWITVVMLVTIIPSIYFGYLLVQKERFAENAAKFIKTVGIVEGNFLLNSEVNTDKKGITLVYGGNSVTESHKNLIREKAAVFSLEKATLDIQQGFTFADFAGNRDEVVQLKAEIGRLNQLLADREKKDDKPSEYQALGKQLLSELTSLYPEILSCSYTEAYINSHADSTANITAMVILGVRSGALTSRERATIEQWLKKRMNKEGINVYLDEQSGSK
jgi:uncharacterized hydrophobic protein (TIGR00271 family)